MDQHPDDAQKPLPLRSVLTRPVLISLANYVVLALFEMASLALIPLIWSTSIEFGGLNFSPASIGLWMSVYGCMDGVFQFTLAPRILERFGAGYAFMTSVTACTVVYIMFPLESLVLRMHQAVGGSNVVAWLLILLQLSSLSFQRMGFSKFCDLDPPHVDATKFNCKAPYIFSSALLHPRSGHWALRMASCRLLCRFNARSDRLRQIRCSRFQLRIISWAGTLYMLCCSFLCPLGCTLPRDFLDIDGHIVAYRYKFVCTSVVGPSSQAMVG